MKLSYHLTNFFNASVLGKKGDWEGTSERRFSLTLKLYCLIILGTIHHHLRPKVFHPLDLGRLISEVVVDGCSVKRYS